VFHIQLAKNCLKRATGRFHRRRARQMQTQIELVRKKRKKGDRYKVK
jgi:hypothetical protein